MAISRWLRRVTRRPDLNALSVAEQCPLTWDQIRGGGAVRDCQHCQSNVYDLSKLNRRAIRKLVSSGESFCGRIERDDKGRLVTAPRMRVSQLQSRLLSVPAWLGIVVAPQLVDGGCESEEASPVEVAAPDTTAASTDSLSERWELRMRVPNAEASLRLTEESLRKERESDYPGGLTLEEYPQPVEERDKSLNPWLDATSGDPERERKVESRQRPFTFGIIRTGGF